MRSTLSFRVTTDAANVRMLTPVVDGRPLTELVAEFETSHGYLPAGGYGGLMHGDFRMRDLARYFLGHDDHQWTRPGYVWLLGCDCGEVGCWPLEARIVTDDETVIWTEFEQPHRPARDYQSFGDFVFDRTAYEQAVRQAVEALEP